MKGISAMVATIWRLATPYFRSEDRRAGRGLLAAVIVIELSLVAINVMLKNCSGYNRYLAIRCRIAELGCLVHTSCCCFAHWQPPTSCSPSTKSI